MMTARLQTSSTSCSRCDERNTVVPPAELAHELADVLHALWVEAARRLVEPITSSGWWTSALAMPRRCFMPCE